MADNNMEQRCFGEELVLSMGDPQKFTEICGKAVEFYGNEICNGLVPMQKIDIPFIYAGLLIIQHTLEGLDPEAKQIGEDIFQVVKKNVNSLVIKVGADGNLQM